MWSQACLTLVIMKAAFCWHAVWTQACVSFRFTCAGYQTTYHSVTQQGTGQWEGVVFQQQFARALQVTVPLLYACLLYGISADKHVAFS